MKIGIKSKWKCNLNYGENEICVNEWNMQDEILNGSLQKKQNRTKETTKRNERNEMEMYLQKLHVQF